MLVRKRRGLALIAGACVVGIAGAATPTADLIVSGGHIRQASGWVTSMAVTGGVIVAMGDEGTVGKLRGPHTRVVSLKGETVLAGLHDVHVHPIFAGITEHQCKFAQGLADTAVRAAVEGCAKRLPAGSWLVGGQWDASALGHAPSRALLDAVTGDHPALLDDTSGHSSWANSLALRAAGITRDTPDPAGGIIERDASGEPTGVLRESGATELVKAKIPRPTLKETKDALTWASHEMLTVGITSFTEASVGFVAGSDNELAAYAELADEGVLKQRTTLCLTWAPGSDEAEAAIAERNRYARPRLRPDCVKIFLDGVPTDSHTAAMLEPYEGTVEGRADAAARSGLLLVPPATLNEAVTRFDAMGLTVKFHAAGDAAVRAGLDAIAAAREHNGFGALMHNVGHCTFVAAADIARARGIGATFEVSPYLWAPSPINDDITAAVGEARIGRVWPVREMLAAGALVVPGSDWSVVPSVDPWIGIETLVTREVPGGSTKSFGKAEAISVSQALELFTANSARQERASDRLGTLETGKLADFIVLNQDPYRVAPAHLHDTRVLATYINGEQVYAAPSAH